MWNRQAMAVAAAFLLCYGVAAASFSSEMLEAKYDALAPAMCLLSFAQEVTDPRTGEPVRREGNALALIVSPDGLLISNGHLQLEHTHSFNFRARVGRGDDEREYPATLLEKPDDINIVLLRIESDTPLRLPYVRFARNPRLRLGEEVALFGVMGDTMDFERGIMLDRITAVLEQPRLTYCLTNALRFGYVSGPVINSAGEVVGITGFDLSRAEGGDLYTRSGHPLVYQADLFAKYIENPPDVSRIDTRAEEAWLGVFTQPLKEDFAAYWGIRESGGLIVSTVVPGSPAEAAGLRPGDIIRRFGQASIRALHDREVLNFTKLVREMAPHSQVEIEFLRGQETLVIPVTLGMRPRMARDAEEFEDQTLGLVVREITRDIRITLNLGEEVRGVIVRRVVSGSPAHMARIRPGVIIMAMGDHPIAGLEDYEAAIARIQADRPAELSVFARVGPTTGFFRVQPRW